jgi:membrane-bound ClpP family serine protease
MGAPLKPRKRRKTVAPAKARHGEKNALWRLWNDPETRPMMIERNRQSAKKGGRPEGVADGTTKEQIAKLRPQAEAKAERIITAMARDDEDLNNLTPDELEFVNLAKSRELAETLVDDEKKTAREALKEAITIAIMPGNRQTKLAAIRTVLEYTKAKPASTVNSNVNAAEDFLLALAKKGS